MATGALPQDVFRLVAGRALFLVGPGLLAGILISYAASRMLATFLFEISATDPFVLWGAPVVLLGIAAAVACVPARRAARLDPVRALHYE